MSVRAGRTGSRVTADAVGAGTVSPSAPASALATGYFQPGIRFNN